jgi:hypothetical protein
MRILNRKRRTDADRIIEEAKRHVGYRSQPNRQSAMQISGYLGKPWNGTFVDRVLHDSIGSPFGEVRFISTVTALAYFVKRNRVYQKPRPGDVVFFSFATDPKHGFEQPHVGIVIEVNSNGSIRTVEGETSPGTPQGSQLADGVFERLRWPADVLGYVRPKGQQSNRKDGEPEKLKLSYFNSNPKTKRRAVEIVQRALNRATGFTFGESNRGKFTGETKSVFGLYARERGSVENRGELEPTALQNLADFTFEFELDD